MWKHVRPWLFPVWCVGCGEPDTAICARCAPAPGDASISVVAGTGVVALGAYDGVLRRAIVAMKHGERGYLDPFAQLLAPVIAAEVTLIPLPTSAGRRAARGFDQAVELARRAAGLRGLPWCDVLLKRGAAQRGRNRLARLAADGCFRIRPVADLPECAIVIDDVCTTGATLTDGITTLRSAGIAVLGAAVLARADRTTNAAGTLPTPLRLLR